MPGAIDSQQSLPTGVVTLLLTDIEGSTRLWETKGPEMGAAVQRHHEIVAGLIHHHNGVRPRDQGEGDSLLAAFARASDASSCALMIQRALREQEWGEGIQIKVRMSIHAGEPDRRDDYNYMGPSLSRAARIRALAHGGQVLVSESAASLLRDSLPPDVELRNVGAYELKDLARTEMVYELRDEETPSFPPPRSSQRFSTNLPAALTTFVPRTEETKKLKGLIADSRLVTVAGSGGSGKTRLALHTVAELLDEFEHGVWVVDLAPLTDRDLVVQTTAQRLGLLQASEETSAEDSRNVHQRLVDHLKDRSLLLMVDNCEHLIEPVASLVGSLMQACPRLKVIATTREPLGVDGETVYRIPSMSLPPDQISDTGDPGQIGQYEAVQLFVARAQQARTSFELDKRNARSVAAICNSLDGIPLAIELAAAKIKVMGAADIASRLQDHFKLLTGGSRTALERQQTLRGAVDWSYTSLTEQEQTLLRRLSVFTGGCTLTSAEEVASDDYLSTESILDVLGALVDKSLLLANDSEWGVRYTMLETIRQYAREKLNETPESKSFRDRHKQHFLVLAETGDFPLHLADEPEAFYALDRELQNLRAAIEWSLADGDIESAGRFVWALYSFMWTRGFLKEITRWLEQLAAEQSSMSAYTYSGVLAAHCRLALYQQDPRARPLAEAAYAQSKESSNLKANLVVLWSLCQDAAWNPGRYKEITEVELLLDEGESVGAQLDEECYILFMRHARTLVTNSLGDYEGAAENSRATLERSREIGFRRGIVLSLAHLAEYHVASGELDVADVYATEAVTVAKELDLQPLTMGMLELLVMSAIHRNDLDRAEELDRTFLRYADSVGDRTMQAWAHGALVYTLLEMDRVAEARDHARRFQELAMTNAPFWSLEGHRHTARLAIAEGRLDVAADASAKALAIARKEVLGARVGCLSGSAQVAALRSMWHEATAWLQEAISLAASTKEMIRFPDMLDCLSYVDVHEGRINRAGVLLGAARSMRERMGTKVNPTQRVFGDSAEAEVTKTMGSEETQRLMDQGAKLHIEDLLGQIVSA